LEFSLCSFFPVSYCILWMLDRPTKFCTHVLYQAKLNSLSITWRRRFLLFPPPILPTWNFVQEKYGE
jgi:hypothetical protein